MKKLFAFILIFTFLAGCAPARPVIGTASPSLTPLQPTGDGIPNTGSSIPNFDHIVLIVLENRDYITAMDGTSMPHFVDMAKQNVLLSNYFAAAHPSLPNYIVLMSGSNQNITSDCLTCFVNQPNLADEIEKSGRNWRAYLEGMPSACFIGDSAPYAQKHNPLLYFDSIRTNSERCKNGIVPLTQLDDDLKNNKLPNFSLIMPNLCDSGHNCTPNVADDWLNKMVDKLQGSDALGKNSLIAITFDEASDSDTSSCCGLGRGGGHVATILISPSAKKGFTDNTPYSHYSLLKTFLRAWNLPDLGRTNKATIEAIEAPWSGASVSANSGNPAVPTGVANQSAEETLTCSSSSPAPGSYTAKICFSDPTDGNTLQGDVNVGATVDVNGAAAQVQRIVYYLDGAYLLTSYYAPFTFILPSANWPDGDHRLSAEALMRDGFTTQRAYISVGFNNGVTTSPVNTNTFKPTSGIPPQNGQPFIVAAVGDGAGGGENPKKVTDLITSLNPNLFLYLGDVYERGSQTEFYNWYGLSSSSFGQLKSITDPTIGNHDYLTKDGAGYFNYWDNIPNYYSFNAGGWHFISLNSNGSKVSTAAGSDQYNWLQQDLEKDTLPCTIVFYHHPLFNIGTEGPTQQMTDVWKLLSDHKVSIVLNGHDHDYQRWLPLDADGKPSPDGITEFVVGTGGHGLQSFPQSDDRVAYSNNSNPAAFGALFLQLNSQGANFTYMSTDRSVLDSGVIPCAGSSADTQAPSKPSDVKATVMTSSRVDLTWSASADNTGVAGYSITRNGINIATVPAYTLEYSDTSVTSAVNYSYSVAAFDSSGHHSLSTALVNVAIPGVATSMAFSPVADTYVNADNPGSNYGKSPFMRINSSPDLHGYLRFKVAGLGGKPIVKARLLLYINNSNSQGLNVTTLVNGKWDEMTMDFTNAPTIGNVLASSGEISAGTWITLDLSQFITEEGTYDLGLTTTTGRPISLATREAGVYSPQLIIDFQ